MKKRKKSSKKSEPIGTGQLNARVLMVLIAFSIVALFRYQTFFSDLTKSFSETYTCGAQLAVNLNTNEEAEEIRLGDGCYNVFLDVGANRGVHGRFLLEPKKYNQSRRAVPLFDYQFGKNRHNEDFCVFEFEANSKHWPRLQEISSAYAKMGWRYHVVEAAVGDRNGTATFFHQGTQDNKFEEWGFSGAKNLGESGGYEEQVPTIHLSKWIQYHIHERKVPEVPPSISAKKSTDDITNTKPPMLAMKMDIEGYEYVVLPDLIHSNVLCHFDFAFGEFHSKFFPIEQFNTDSSNPHRVSLRTKREIDDFNRALVKVMHSSRNCGVKWQSIDDESYLHDDMPLPSP